MDSPAEADAEPHVRIRQQEVVSELGQRALESDDLDQLMHDASVAVAETLDAEYAKVLELLPDGDELFLRQGVGWREGLAGSATVPVNRASQAGYTLRSQTPVVVDDLRTEERFSGPELLTDHGVVSGISVVIGSVSDPWGVLGAHATEEREFTSHDAHFVKSVANVLASAIENERTQSELEEIYGRISDAFFALDAKWTFTYLNDQAHALINPEERTLIGENIWAAFPEGAERKFKPKYEDAMYEQETVSFEEYYPDPLDTWFEVRAYPSETGLSVYFRDITARKERERELEETERRFDAIFEDPNILVGLLDLDGTVIDINRTAMEYIEADIEDVTGKPFWNTPWWGTGDEVRGDIKEWTERAATGEYVDFEADLTRPDGERYTLNGVFRPVTNDDDEVVSVIVSDRDVSERRQYERRLEESEHRYRTLAESFPNGIVTLFDDTLRYTLAEGRAFDYLPVSKDDVEDKTPKEVWGEEMGSKLEDGLRATLDGDERRIEVTYAGREWVVHTVPLTDTKGDVSTGMTMAQDITERKEYERKLEESNERLEESNRRLEQFAYAASHDLQEPLRMVSSYLRLVERRYADELDEDGREFIEYAVDGADRMRDMVEALLKYSRVEAKGDALEPVELDAVLDDVLADLQLRIEETGADVTVGSLPRVNGDASQLRQLLQNLLDNALTYSGDEPPTVEVSAERRGRTWVVSVRDEGVGIDPDETDTVFEVFQRLHGREEYAGTGVGLALCERIVERHGGEIWADSEPGEWSTFSFTLPEAGESDE
ncbi:PAS domain S-box-containing protein [Halopelagius inordinatus]|uniref:histidine kinase n=1 Tax=Halopelagius inordinatus TaxID=553467 RepID=A0A1I2T1A3_9EURY|nr:PAS domain-containing protein [Halopelagius inordinatus]SFG58885.1 PAS domain S-box-containing protein [Halopelagius inordinatus]